MMYTPNTAEYPLSPGGGFFTITSTKEIGFYPVNVESPHDYLREVESVRKQIMGLDGVESVRPAEVTYDSQGFPRFHLSLERHGRPVDMKYFRNVITGQWWLEASSKDQAIGLEVLTSNILSGIIKPRIQELKDKAKATMH
ncbi:MAG: hypothetical protein KKE20_00250 [Nanoarchaeota archaeon]|nr:hypothetical protein [Nanoarchaeota archaeon]